MKIAVYASAHGYGHASRSFEIARALVERDSSVTVWFTSYAPETFFDAEEQSRIIRRRRRLDVGMKQISSLQMDIPGTLTELDQCAADADRLIAEEIVFLRENEVQIVLADLPPLVFEAAHHAGIPCWGMSNFSWDWIYEEYAEELPGLKRHIQRIRAAYAQAAGLFRLPLHNDMEAFARIIDVPLVARLSKWGRSGARRRLGWDDEVKVVLFSFGGFPLKTAVSWQDLQGWILVSTDPSSHPGTPFHHFSNADLQRSGLRYCDLVAAADVVISKLGYGIVSECLANRTALVYMPRGRFREYPLLQAGVQSHLSAEEIQPEDLESGRWVEICERVIGKPMPRRLDCRGTARIVDELLALAQRGGQ